MASIVDPRIRLTKSKLFVEENELIKRGLKDEEIGRFSLSNIESVELTRKFEPINLGFAALLFGVAVMAKVYIPLYVLSWVVSVLLVGVGLFPLLSPYKPQILIKTKNGTVNYDLMETREEANGFIVSLLETVKSTDKPV